MKRIILHWTAGTNQPNSTDYEHYHYLINGDGMVINGKYTPEDNLDCSDKKYAQHTGGGNTGSIGVAMCGMYGYKSPSCVGNFPLTATQCETTFKKVAQLCKKYNIKITPEIVLTHYEFGKSHPNTTSHGKIDITFLPYLPKLKADEVGNYIRNKVIWYSLHV